MCTSPDLAAVREVDLPHFQTAGEIRLLPSAVNVAQAYVSMNTSHFTSTVSACR